MAYRNYAPANGFLVDKTGNGDFTSIQAAITAATAGKTVYIMPSSTPYIENITGKASVDITSWISDGSLNATGNVVISGTITMTAAGTFTVSGIQLQTNSAPLLAVTGSANSIVNVDNCYLSCTNNTGISYTSSGASSGINIFACNGNIGTTGIALFASSGSGILNIENCFIANTGGSSTANTCSAGALNIYYSQLTNPVTTSGTAAFNHASSLITTSAQNVTALTVGGSGSSGSTFCRYYSGTASAVSIGATLNINLCEINSNNTNAITGAGTINRSGLAFTGTSSVINTTTQGVTGTLIGTKNVVPTAGMIGERIKATVASTSAVSVPSATQTNITSISLTAGTYNVSGIVMFKAAAITGTQFVGSVNTVSATVGTAGDNSIDFPYAPTAASNMGIVIPPWSVTVSTTTTCYLVALAAYTVGSLTAFGSITATRVG